MFTRTRIAVFVWSVFVAQGVFAQTAESPYVSSLRELTGQLIALDSDAAIRDWFNNHDSDLRAKRASLEAMVNSQYPRAMRDAKLDDALRADYEPLLAKKVAAFKRGRESVHCDGSLFTRESKVVDFELGSVDNGVATIFATIDYPENARKFMPIEAYPPDRQIAQSDKTFASLKSEEWYWLRRAVVRFFVYNNPPTDHPGTTSPEGTFPNDSGFVVSQCNFVDVAVYGSAMADSNQPSRSVAPTVTKPVVLREVKPTYTSDAERAKVQGSVWLELTVLPDGTVGDVKVVRSLDPIFGLDQAATAAAKQWRFRPGMRGDQPVESKVTIELTFTLR